MSQPVHLINFHGIPIVDLKEVLTASNAVPQNQKLEEICYRIGCQSHSKGTRFITTSKCALVGIGGLAFKVDTNNNSVGFHGLTGMYTQLCDLTTSLKEMPGFAAFMSYLNPNGRAPIDLCNIAIDHGHRSVDHTVYLNCFIAGCSTATELEFATQRDKIHIARVTNARTSAQDHPPINVEGLANAHRLIELIEDVDTVANDFRLASNSLSSDREWINSIYPTRKATCFLLSGTKRAIDSLLPHASDCGKEREYRTLVNQLCEISANLW